MNNGFLPYCGRFRLIWTPFLKRRNGKTLQALGLVCPPVLGSGGDFELRIGARKYAARPMDLLRYPTGTREQDQEIIYLWLVPRVSKPASCRVTWKTTLGQTYRAEITLPPADPRRIHVLFKTHLDLGYTARFAEVVRLYQTQFMDRLLDNLDATASRRPGKRFVWTLSTWLMEQCLDPKAVRPEQLRRFEHHVREGSIAWGLMPFTTHSEFLGLEEMCRSIYAARRLAERFGRPVPRAAKMTDVPAHTSSLAMAFAAAGGIFFQIGTNPESRPPQVPPLFWWKLPDGKRMLVHYHGAYGTPLLPPEDWPHTDWLAVQITSDNVGPQSLALLDHIDWIERHFDSPVCRTGRLEDFADAVIREESKTLPVFDRELTDWWIHGIASQARPTALARRTKERLPSAETLLALGRWRGDRAEENPSAEDPPAAIREAYEQLALYTEHTWGDHATDGRTVLPKGNLYISPLFAGRSAKPPIDRWALSWEDKARFADNAQTLVNGIEQEAVSSFFAPARSPDATVGVALFNTLNWSRGGLVRLNAEGLPAGEFELINPDTGESVLYDRKGVSIEFIAPPVPPCGYLVLQVRPVARRRLPGMLAEWFEPRSTMHSEEYSLQFHENGGLARWYDRARSAQWCSGEADHPMGAYLYEMPGGDKLRAFARQVHSNVWPQTAGFFHRHDYERMQQFGPVGGGKAKLHPEITPLYARVTLTAACPSRRVPQRRSGDVRGYALTFTHYRGMRDIRVRLVLHGKRPAYAAEAGYAYFPFYGDSPKIRVDRIARIIEPAKDLARGVNAAHMAVHRGIRVQNSHAGMNFYPLDNPLLSFGVPGAYAFSEDARYKNGDVYATLFNNCWGTNFAQWQSGDFSFEFVCRPTGNDGADGGLARGGAEVFRPLLAAVVPYSGEAHARVGGDRCSRSFLSIDPPDVQLVTLKPAEFDRGIIARLWNASPAPVTARLRLPESRRTQLSICDLVERPTGRKLTAGARGEFRVPLSGHQILTLLIR